MCTVSAELRLLLSCYNGYTDLLVKSHICSGNMFEKEKNLALVFVEEDLQYGCAVFLILWGFIACLITSLKSGLCFHAFVLNRSREGVKNFG